MSRINVRRVGKIYLGKKEQYMQVQSMNFGNLPVGISWTHFSRIVLQSWISKGNASPSYLTSSLPLSLRPFSNSCIHNLKFNQLCHALCLIYHRGCAIHSCRLLTLPALMVLNHVESSATNAVWPPSWSHQTLTHWQPVHWASCRNCVKELGLHSVYFEISQISWTYTEQMRINLWLVHQCIGTSIIVLEFKSIPPFRKEVMDFFIIR